MNINNIIKKEADALLYNHKLFNLLSSFTNSSNIYITGSYYLDVMAWRDLDLYIDIKDFSQTDIYNIVKKIMDEYKPTWIETKDTHFEDSGCPKGYFLGFETYVVSSDLWNVDIWFTDKDFILDHLKYMENIKVNLDDEKRNIIINKKIELIKTGKYHTKYSSVDVYQMVLKGERKLQ